MNRRRTDHWWIAVASAALLSGFVGCSSSSDSAGSRPAATTAPATSVRTPSETTAKVRQPCSEAVISGEVFDEEMVAECLQISGVTSATCPDGSIVGLIDVSGTPLVVHAGTTAERVDGTVAKKLSETGPPRYDVDTATLSDRCG